MMGHAKRNAPFGMRHEYKYDVLGRITEQQAFNSDGKLRWTKKYTNSPTGRDIQTLDETGGFLTRSFETFDKNGNVVEYKVLDMSGKPVWTHRYVHEFDEAGNWIVRKTYLVGAARAKTTKPSITIFRAITYCDDRSV
jgi:YD repeat-containing protein